MSTLTHPHRLDFDVDLPQHLRHAASRAAPIVFSVLVFAILFAALTALRLAAMAGRNPEAAATLHRALHALGVA